MAYDELGANLAPANSSDDALLSSIRVRHGLALLDRSQVEPISKNSIYVHVVQRRHDLIVHGLNEGRQELWTRMKKSHVLLRMPLLDIRRIL